MNHLNRHRTSKRSLALSVRVSALLFLASLLAGWAQTTVTSNPQNGARGVSVSAPVTFMFSASVDPAATVVTFFSTNPAGNYSVSTNWNGGNTVLTCTPISPFPANASIGWDLYNVAANVFAQGSFSTGTNSSGGGGSGTNAITTFSVGKFYIYQQLTPGAPTPDTNAPYGFFASASLASNQTASAVTVTLPAGGGPRNLAQSPARQEVYNYFGYGPDTNTFESTYPEGDYVFNVTGTPANLQSTVTLPASMPQPNAPHISNFTNIQSVVSAQPFQVSWDPFQSGTVSDVITVSANNEQGTNLFQTPNPGMKGALNGTATTVTIPAGKLPANSTNTALVVFYRALAATNSTYATFAYRATGTQFTIFAVGSVSTVPVVLNPAWTGANFGFDVSAASNEVLKVRYSPDCSQPIAQWQTILTTNNSGTSVHIILPPQQGTNVFFRVQGGS